MAAMRTSEVGEILTPQIWATEILLKQFMYNMYTTTPWRPQDTHTHTVQTTEPCVYEHRAQAS